jgi:hypothetical protein
MTQKIAQKTPRKTRRRKYWAFFPARRQVSAGMYFVKGVVKTSDGKREKVSVIVGVG